MKDILQGWESKSNESEQELDSELEHFLQNIADCIEKNRNNISGLEDEADVNWRTAKKRAVELKNKGFVEIEGLGDRNSKTLVTLCEKGEKHVDSSYSKDLRKEIEEFQDWFLRYPTREELKIICGSASDEELAKLDINYFEPEESTIKEADIKLWMILLSEVKKTLSSLDFDHLMPQNIYWDELKDMGSGRINREREIEQQEYFDREKLMEKFNEEKLYVQEKTQKSLVDEDAEMNYSIVKVELPEPYKSYFNSKTGEKYLTYITRPEADVVPMSFWEKLKFVVKSELPFLETPMKRIY